MGPENRISLRVSTRGDAVERNEPHLSRFFLDRLGSPVSPHPREIRDRSYDTDHLAEHSPVVLWGSGLTYMDLCQVFSYPLKFCRQTGIRFRTFAQTIDRLTPSSNRP